MNNVIKDLSENGVHLFGEIIDKNKMKALFELMKSNHEFSEELFLTEKEYELQGNNLNANPEKTTNFLDKFSNELLEIEKNELIESNIIELLGEDYEIVIKKAVCGVPQHWIPQWVKEKIKGVNVANLGAYMKPEYRDITYFRGIDFHQDIIDWPKGSTVNKPNTFLTLYVYLHDVEANDSPLHIMPKTHKYGATIFPHNLKKLDDNKWNYSEKGKSIICDDIVLKGNAGYVGLWHNCTLHGTQPIENESDNMRLSLRYLISKKITNTIKTAIDKINENIDGDLEPIITRMDLDKNGKAKIKGNIINSY